MKASLKKIIIILPVIAVSLFYLRVLYHESYSGASFKRVAGLVLSVLLLYVWIIITTIRRRQDNFLQGFILSSFFVYIFFVLQLTGYFILFKEISSHDWWNEINYRIKIHDHVNLEPFKMFRIYDRFDKQIVGNFVMLLPLGVYLPFLYRRFRKFAGFFAVTFISFLVSVSIEILQLATNYRSTDVDDIILNTLGAVAGFLIYQVIRAIISRGQGQTDKVYPDKHDRMISP